MRPRSSKFRKTGWHTSGSASTCSISKSSDTENLASDSLGLNGWSCRASSARELSLSPTPRTRIKEARQHWTKFPASFLMGQMETKQCPGHGQDLERVQVECVATPLNYFAHQHRAVDFEIPDGESGLPLC